MVTRRWCLDGLVDEIPDIRTAGAATSPQPLLVLPHLACCCPVCPEHLAIPNFRANWHSFRRALSNQNITDVRSDDEDDGELVPPAEAANCPRDVLVASEVADLCAPALRDLLADTAIFMNEDVQDDNSKTAPSRTAQKRPLTELDWTMA